MEQNSDLPQLKKHPVAFTGSDLVDVWYALNARGREVVAACAIAAGRNWAKEASTVNVVFELFTATRRSSAKKWRQKDMTSLPVVSRSLEGLTSLLRTVGANPFLADEPVLWRVPIQHGHFAIGGRDKRIVIVGLTSTMDYNGLFGRARKCLESFVRHPPENEEAWLSEYAEPEWAALDRRLDESQEEEF